LAIAERGRGADVGAGVAARRAAHHAPARHHAGDLRAIAGPLTGATARALPTLGSPTDGPAGTGRRVARRDAAAVRARPAAARIAADGVDTVPRAALIGCRATGSVPVFTGAGPIETKTADAVGVGRARRRFARGPRGTDHAARAGSRRRLRAGARAVAV